MLKNLTWFRQAFKLYCSDKIKFKMTFPQKRVFYEMVQTDEQRYKTPLHVIRKDNHDFMKLYTFCILKRILIFLPIVTLAKQVNIKRGSVKNIKDWKLYSIIGQKPYQEIYDGYKRQKFIKESWKGLPIVAKYNGKNMVIDGNHRLAQQIYKNKDYCFLYVSNNITLAKFRRKFEKRLKR